MAGSSQTVDAHLVALKEARRREREHREAWESASKDLTALIHQARSDRATFKEIEEATGMNRSAVNQRLKRHEQESG